MRGRYVKRNRSRLDAKEKREVMKGCKVNELGSDELEELESMGVLSDRDMLDIHRRVIKCRDEELKRIVKEKEDAVKRVNEPESNCK